MTILLNADEGAVSALRDCINVIRHLADSTMPPALEQRLRTLSAHKEFLNEGDRGEFSALTDFWRKRAVEKLEARVTLNRLREKFPTLFDAP